MPSNLSQTNFGEIGADKPVDVWHIDSVDYVLVILLSDASNMVGGDLLVARLNGGDPALAIETINTRGIDPSEYDKASYPGPGHAILMQGSRIAHCVTPVIEAVEPRLTVVNSYQSLNVFEEDKTRFVTYRDVDGIDTARYEYARHKAWRVKGQLEYLLRGGEGGEGGKGMFEDNGMILDILENAEEELKRARELVSGKAIDERPYKVTGE
jgi:hypothetical protein